MWGARHAVRMTARLTRCPILLVLLGPSLLRGRRRRWKLGARAPRRGDRDGAVRVIVLRRDDGGGASRGRRTKYRARASDRVVERAHRGRTTQRRRRRPVAFDTTRANFRAELRAERVHLPPPYADQTVPRAPRVLAKLVRRSRVMHFSQLSANENQLMASYSHLIYKLIQYMQCT